MNTERHASFDRIASRYDATRVLPPAQQHQIARGIMAAVRGGMGTRFVEPGVGTGRIALPLLRAAAKAGVSAVDTDDLLQKSEDIAQQVRGIFEGYVGKPD